ncbi:ABC transporter permease [Paludibaculum fermentans]|uniref:ABC transporter permease n=1 Tax=Paludibaculum fermentans TaxID=1473598 RepID=A0A7S7SLC4_PALFE|nr:ABC transporter permease [Paludibaculum fermentans]QOY87910.1 ABC transporter permease [Paludibaculum fermentans]
MPTNQKPGNALFRGLLWLYPAEFRDEYGREMSMVFSDRYCSASTAGERLRVWFEALTGVLMEAPREQLAALNQDVRYALRTLRKTPSFSLTAVLTLALAIGATTVIFSLLHAMLLRPLPFQNPEQIVRILSTYEKLGITSFTASVPDFVSWQQRTRGFTQVGGFTSRAVILTGDGQPEHAEAAAISANLVPMLGIQPLLGRAFLPEEDKPRHTQVAMISKGLLDRRYGGDASIVGRTIRVDGQARTVVGVLPQQMGFSSKPELWLPLAPDLAKENRSNHYLTVLARLKPGVGLSEAQADLNRVCAELGREFPGSNDGWAARMVPVLDWIVGSKLKTSLWVLISAVGLLLLVACANIANLLLTRASARQEEMSVRLALGASRVRLLRQLLTENIVLAVCGGGAGLVLAAVGLAGLQKLLPAGTPRVETLTLESPVLLFVSAVTLATSVLFGFAPAWLVSRSALNSTLRQTGRTHSGRNPLRQSLVVVQMAMATVLVIGTALLLQSLARLQDSELGFRPDHVLVASVSLPESKYPTLDHAAAFYRRLLPEVQALPGVTSTGMTSMTPMSGDDTSMSVAEGPGPAQPQEKGRQASWRIISPGTMETMGVKLLRGRFFSESDRFEQRPMVISEGLARRLWPEGTDPLQQQVHLGNGQMFNIVGVVADVRHKGRGEDPPPTMYMHSAWSLWPTMVLMVRTSGDPLAMAGPLRAAVRKIDPDQPLFAIRTMSDLVAADAAQPRLRTGLMAAFAVLALILGALGVSGVVAYGVARRTRELALRMALGATPGQVQGNVMSSGALLAMLGLAVGLAAALGLGRFLSSLLYQVQPNDPVTFSTIGATLLVVSLLACWVPARRAVRIDPATSLRNE